MLEKKMTQEEIIEIIDDVIVDIIETHHDDTKVLERLQKKIQLYN